MAYQLALQAQKSRPMGASAAEVIETRSSKPVPKPRVGREKSAVTWASGPRAPGRSGVEGSGAAVTPPCLSASLLRPRCCRPGSRAVVPVTPAPPPSPVPPLRIC